MRANPWDRVQRPEEGPIGVSPLLQEGRNARYASGNTGGSGIPKPRQSLGQRLMTEQLGSIQEESRPLASQQPQRYWEATNYRSTQVQVPTTIVTNFKTSEASALRKTREKVQTELQTLSSHVTWFFLMLPAGLAFLALLVPAGYTEEVLLMTASNAAAYSYNAPPSVARVHAHVDWERHALLVQPTKSANSCGFIQVFASVPGPPSLSSQQLASTVVTMDLYLSDGIDLDRSIASPIGRRADSVLVASHSVALADVLLSSLPSPSSPLAAEQPAASERVISFPLLYESFSSPGLTSGSVRYPVAVISVQQTGGPAEGDQAASEGAATAVFNAARFRVVMQSQAYLVTEVVLRLGCALVCLGLLFLTCTRLFLYLSALGPGASTCSQHVEAILPEQMTSLLMLVSLLLYQSPLCATVALCALAGADLKDSFVLTAGCSEELAQFVLLACSLVYLDGLKYAPGERYYEDPKVTRHRERQRRRTGPTPPLFLGQYQNDEEEEGALSGSRDLSGDWWGGWKPAGVGGGGSGSASKAGWSISVPVNMGVGATTAENSPVPGSRDSSLASRNDSSLTNSLSLDRSFLGIVGSRQSKGGTKLSVHHPLSNDFLDFMWSKLLLLLTSWACCAAAWTFRYSTVAAPLLGGRDTGQQRQRQRADLQGAEVSAPLLGLAVSRGDVATMELLFLAFGVATKLLYIVWFLAIARAVFRTEARLRTAKFFASRFRQMAFRLLSIQLLVGLAVFSSAGSLRLMECARLFSQSFEGLFPAGVGWVWGASSEELSSLRHLLSAYLASGYLAPFGGFRLIALLFLSSLSFTIAYLLMPAFRDKERLAGAGSQALFSSRTVSSGLGNADAGSYEHSLGASTQPVSDYDRSHAFVALEEDYWIHNPAYGAHASFNAYGALVGLPSTAADPSSRGVSFAGLGLGPKADACSLDAVGSSNSNPKVGYQMFCLETALVLMEMSYQSYYRPDLAVTIDGRDVRAKIEEDSIFAPLPAQSAPASSSGKAAEASEPRDSSAPASSSEGPSRPRMDLMRLNVDLLSVFHGDKRTFGFMTETSGAAGQGHGAAANLGLGGPDHDHAPQRLIVCFRGTDNQDNVITDLTLSQAELPPLRLKTKDFRRKLLRALDLKAGLQRQQQQQGQGQGDGQGQGEERSGDGEATSSAPTPPRGTLSSPSSPSSPFTPATPLSPLSPLSGAGAEAEAGAGAGREKGARETTLLYSELDGRDRTGNYGIGAASSFSSSSSSYLSGLFLSSGSHHRHLSAAAQSGNRPSPPVIDLLRASGGGGGRRAFPSASVSASWDEESLAGSPSSAAGGGVFSLSLNGSRAPTPLNGVDEVGSYQNGQGQHQGQQQGHQQQQQQKQQQGQSGDLAKDDNSANDSSSLSSSSDLVGCLRSALAQLPVLQQTLPLVHLGFWRVYTSMRAQVLSSVLMGIFQHYERASLSVGAGTGVGAGAEPLQISFCGHSLGGGLAVLAALDVATNLGVMCRAARDCVFLRLHSSSSSSSSSSSTSQQQQQQQQQLGIDVVLPNISLYTFGCPRVGNKLFCDALKKRVPTVYRVELEGDSITMMPPNYLGFYRHCGRRVVVDPHGSGSLIVKPTIVETVLLGKSSYSVVNHSLDSYRVALEACFSPDELAVYLSKEYHRTIGGRAGPVAPLPAWLTDEQY